MYIYLVIDRSIDRPIYAPAGGVGLGALMARAGGRAEGDELGEGKELRL